MTRIPASVSLPDRLFSMLSYISAGWVGMIYLIILCLYKKRPSKFLRYNVFQSIFISLLYFVLCMVIGFACGLLLKVPYLNYIVSWFVLKFNKPLIMQYSLIQVFMIGLFLYMALLSLFGRYPRIYWISSNIIDRTV